MPARHTSPHKLHDLSPADDREGEQKGSESLADAQGEDENHRQQEGGEGGEHFGRAHNEPVNPRRAEPAGQRAQDEADEQAGGDDHAHQKQRLLSPGEDQAENVPAEHVAAQQVFVVRSKGRHAELAAFKRQTPRVVGAHRRQLRAEEEDDGEDQNEEQTGDKGQVAERAAPPGAPVEAPRCLLLVLHQPPILRHERPEWAGLLHPPAAPPPARQRVVAQGILQRRPEVAQPSPQTLALGGRHVVRRLPQARIDLVIGELPEG